MDGIEEISQHLFQYLSEKVVGSKSVVKFRRDFFKSLDNINSNEHFVIISSGSKAEGMDLPGSDYDMMAIFKGVPVFENETQLETVLYRGYINIAQFIPFIMETKDARPGFVLLRIHTNVVCPPETPDFIIYRGRYLSGISMKTLLTSMSNDHGISLKIHGPCVTDMFGSIDTAPTLKCDTWPRFLKPWFSRRRWSGWPSAYMISKICNQGVLFVPIGSKSFFDEENPVEWRISFSEAEKLLIHSWNHTQFLCYAMLKILIKDAVKNNKVICSYFLKTTMLWLCEEYSYSVWKPNNLLRCLLSCVGRLIFFYEHNYIPNYFIPEHNMINRITDQQLLSELLATLHSLQSMRWPCIFHCEFIKQLTDRQPFLQLNICSFENSSIYLLSVFFKYGLNDSLQTCLAKAQNIQNTKKTRSLCSFYVAQICRSVSNETFCSRHVAYKNKQDYQQQKRWLSYAVVGAYTDLFQGWLAVAVFFYQNRQYYKSIQILDHLDFMFCCRILNLYPILAHIHHKQLHGQTTFLRNIRLANPLTFHLKISPGDVFLENSFPIMKSMLICEPSVFLYYLKFLCMYQIRDPGRWQKSIENLIWVVEKIYRNRDLEQSLNGCIYIAKAYHIIRDYQNERKWISIAKLIQDAN